MMIAISGAACHSSSALPLWRQHKVVSRGLILPLAQ